ncbi:MAG: sigma-70 family RNA polymerase sigma factor [Roseiflexaceae bacterium]|nr:sigma-70 family RNA polymerase sigma factor [Roseiflexaceae bacterium]
MVMHDDLSALAAAAQNGSKDALEALIGAAQQPIYNLALRMLQRPMDAEDATQEILIKLITHKTTWQRCSGSSPCQHWPQVGAATLPNSSPRLARRKPATP